MSDRLSVAHAGLSPRLHHRNRLLQACAVLALSAAGCISPEYAVRDADQAAYSIIEQKQIAALGRSEPFTIELPEDQLRRRLLLDQQLPAAGPASFGRAYLPPVPKQPDGVSAGLELPETAQIASVRDTRVTGVNTPNLSTDLFLMQIGPDPESLSEVRGERPPERLVLGPPAPNQQPAPEPMLVTLVDALQIGALNSRTYQAQKEQVYLAALDLDLERDDFEFQFAGTLDADITSELEGDDTTGVSVSPALGVDKVFKSGAIITSRIGLDLAKLLTGDRSESLGLFADASITIPLLRGAGVEVVTEPLQQAERDAVYAIWNFEQFKREFAVDVAQQYFNVLVSRESIDNNRATLERLSENVLRSRALVEEGRLPPIQLDEVISNQLQASQRLLVSEQQYEERLDQFKVFLGLPADALIILDESVLENLQDTAAEVLGPELLEALEEPADATADGPATGPATAPGGGGLGPPSPTGAPPEDSLEDLEEDVEADVYREVGDEVDPTEKDPIPVQPATLPEPVSDEEARRFVEEAEDLATPPQELATANFADRAVAQQAIRVALQNRLDLAIAYGEVVDAQRQTVVAADALEAFFDLVGSAGAGGRRGSLSGGSPDSDLRFDEGTYSAGLRFDLPIERTQERNAYRASIINLERAIRDAQDLEDRIKLQIISTLRDLRVSGEELRIQYESIQVARRRVASANLQLDLGRVQVRDVTEAEDDLVNAENDFTQAIIDFRLAELELQRDLGVLQVDERGLYNEVPILGGP